MEQKPHSELFATVRDYIFNSIPTQPVQGFPGADANDALARIEEQLETLEAALREGGCQFYIDGDIGACQGNEETNPCAACAALGEVPNPAKEPDAYSSPQSVPAFWIENRSVVLREDYESLLEQLEAVTRNRDYEREIARMNADTAEGFREQLETLQEIRDVADDSRMSDEFVGNATRYLLRKSNPASEPKP